MTRGSIISKGILAAIIVFFSIFLFAFLEISKITPLDKNRPKNVNELEEMLSSEYRHFCFFTAFANGPKKPDIPWFEGSDERLNDQILAEYMELFPVADSQALLFFFDSDASIITAILLHENMVGY